MNRVMRNNKMMLALLIACCECGVSHSLDAYETAAHYSLNQTSNFDMSVGFVPNINTSPLNPNGSRQMRVVDAATVGGSDALNENGRCFMLQTIYGNAPGNIAANAYYQFEPSVGAPADGQEYEFICQLFDGRIQVITNPASPSGPALLLFGNFGNYEIAAAGNFPTTIPVSAPVRFVLTNNYLTTGTMDVEMTNLETGTTQSQTVPVSGSAQTSFSWISFAVSADMNRNNTKLLFNNLGYAATGGVPVELSGFELE